MLRKFQDKAKRLKNEIHAVYLAYTKHKLPWYAKVLAAAVMAYALSPIDLIPDFIPILGLLDDLILLPLGIALLIKLIPPEVMEECREQAQNEGKGKLPKNYLMAAVFVLIWAGVIFLVVYKIIKSLS